MKYFLMAVLLLGVASIRLPAQTLQARHTAGVATPRVVTRKEVSTKADPAGGKKKVAWVRSDTLLGIENPLAKKPVVAAAYVLPISEKAVRASYPLESSFSK